MGVVACIAAWLAVTRTVVTGARRGMWNTARATRKGGWERQCDGCVRYWVLKCPIRTL